MGMKLWCFEDSQGWGQSLCAAAQSRGIDCSLFDDVSQVRHNGKLNYVFFHMHHHPKVRNRHKQMMEALHKHGFVTIPDIGQARLYDDKLAQARAFKKWMPKTWYFDNVDKAHAFLKTARYPLMSKAREGASSHNVRLLPDMDAARREMSMAFGAGGIPLRYDMRQRGYVLWQQFVPGNDWDIRVIAIGEQRLVLRRFNRDNRPMASGSGKLDHIVSLHDPMVLSAYCFADEFFKAERLTWCGIDLVFDYEAERWRLLETTVGWTMPGYFDCAFFPDGRMGSDVWEVTLDEMIRGALG